MRRQVKLLGLAWMACTVSAGSVAVSRPFDPDDWEGDPKSHLPTEKPGAGCNWDYDNGWYSVRDEIVTSTDTPRFSSWELLSNCGCGWYPAHIPCPPCPVDSVSRTLSDVGNWSIKTGTTTADGFSLKATLKAEVGSTHQLSQSEEASLSGSHTVTTTYTLNRQKLLCFDRHYRQGWQHRVRARKRYADWTYA